MPSKPQFQLSIQTAPVKISFSCYITSLTVMKEEQLGKCTCNLNSYKFWVGLIHKLSLCESLLQNNFKFIFTSSNIYQTSTKYYFQVWKQNEIVNKNK